MKPTQSKATEQATMVTPIKSALDLKNEGNAHFTKRHFAEALACYSEGISIVSKNGDGGNIGVNVNDENAENHVKQQHDDDLEATLFSNRSGCYYEMGDYGEHIASLGNHVVSCKYGGIIGVHIT